MWNERLTELIQYLQRCEELMLHENTATDDDLFYNINYSHFDMNALIDVYASWCACLSDLQQMLVQPIHSIPYGLFDSYHQYSSELIN